MTRASRLLIPLGVLAFGVLGAAVLMSARPKVQRQEVAVPPPLVRVVEVGPQDIRLTVESQGTVEPLTESVLVSQVAGQIVSVAPAFAPGGFFGPRETLIRIDPRDYELAVEQAEARLAQAEVRLDLERAEAEIARRDWQELGEGEPTALALREPQMAEAEANLRSARAALRQAELNLERTTVSAPFAGRVQEKLVDVGQFVAPGTRLAGIYSIEAAEVRLPVSRADLAFLEIDLGRQGEGPAVTLGGELGGELLTWPARIVRTGSAFDPRSRMLPLYARVDDPFGRLGQTVAPALPMGLFVEAAIEGRLAAAVVSVPRSAVRDDGRILIVDDDDRLRFREVEVLRLESERAILRSGVEAGERVCVSQLETVVDGMSVRTVTDSPAAAPDTVEEGS